MTVYLVGAGPGDPGLITVRGAELVRSCDVLVYDRLVASELVMQAPAESLRIPRERFGQDELNALLVSLGQRELEVVRLKGGDPFLFGRGGEEAIALAQAGVPFEVMPGVSALAAVPATAGIPITHRGLSSQVTVVSGHDPDALDIDALAVAAGTLVVFMGLATFETIAERLIDAGKEPNTPAAVIASGTTCEQQTIVAPLAEVAARAQKLRPPALIIVGEVVGVHAQLDGTSDGTREEVDDGTSRARRATDLGRVSQSVHAARPGNGADRPRLFLTTDLKTLSSGDTGRALARTTDAEEYRRRTRVAPIDNHPRCRVSIAWRFVTMLLRCFYERDFPKPLAEEPGEQSPTQSPAARALRETAALSHAWLRCFYAGSTHGVS